jgi:hypothetical protein
LELGQVSVFARFATERNAAKKETMKRRRVRHGENERKQQGEWKENHTRCSLKKSDCRSFATEPRIQSKKARACSRGQLGEQRKKGWRQRKKRKKKDRMHPELGSVELVGGEQTVRPCED